MSGEEVRLGKKNFALIFPFLLPSSLVYLCICLSLCNFQTLYPLYSLLRWCLSYQTIRGHGCCCCCCCFSAASKLNLPEDPLKIKWYGYNAAAGSSLSLGTIWQCTWMQILCSSEYLLQHDSIAVYMYDPGTKGAGCVHLWWDYRIIYCRSVAQDKIIETVSCCYVFIIYHFSVLHVFLWSHFLIGSGPQWINTFFIPSSGCRIMYFRVLWSGRFSPVWI